jgi:ATP-binding cassette subfamily F protein uup
MVEWLEDFLVRSTSALLMVTHDRYFLDNICNEITELEDGKLYFYSGNYSYFLEKKEERMANRESELEKDRNIYRNELEWMRKQPKARTTKSKSRIDSFGDLEEKVKGVRKEQELRLNVKMNRIGGKVLEMKKVIKNTGTPIFSRVSTTPLKPANALALLARMDQARALF